MNFTVPEIAKWSKDGSLKEMFGTGTVRPFPQPSRRPRLMLTPLFLHRPPSSLPLTVSATTTSSSRSPSARTVVRRFLLPFPSYFASLIPAFPFPCAVGDVARVMLREIVGRQTGAIKSDWSFEV
jgi:hypothetical protein